jgi:hypothetical protein
VAGGVGESGPAPDRPRGLRTKSAWLLAIPFLVAARPTGPALAAGAAVAAAGLLLRGWAAGTIRKDEALTTTGPYARLRHPLYVGSFLIGTGLAVAGGHWLWPVLVLAFFAAVYRRTVAEEAERLTSLFGERYWTYAANVPAVLPRLRPYGRTPEEPSPRGPDDGFAWPRYLRNREWEALLGVGAALAVLAAKAILPG